MAAKAIGRSTSVCEVQIYVRGGYRFRAGGLAVTAKPRMVLVMPYASSKICTRPGCAGLVRGGVCSVCGPRRKERDAQHDARRGTAASRGYDGRWQRIRMAYLKGHPLCAECLKEHRVTVATDVDHIIPKRDGGSDADGNLQALCHSCHSRKTAGGQ
jgi:5-methylcytosine-specific restriction protein A